MGSYGSVLVEKLPRVADVVSFRFERPEAYRFRAGQWFTITFPSPDPEVPWEHHFSHSDSPTEPWLEFTTRLRGSDFKNALDALPLGATVQLEGPYGLFTLGGEVQRAAFLAGGIGITCVRSILKWACDTCSLSAGGAPTDVPRAAPKEIVLFYANRSEDAIPFERELEGFTRSIPGFRVVHVLSQPGKAWQGYRGHLDQDILAAEIADPAGWDFFVSGPPSFDQAMRGILLKWGVTEEHVLMEQFMGY